MNSIRPTRRFALLCPLLFAFGMAGAPEDAILVLLEGVPSGFKAEG